MLATRFIGLPCLLGIVFTAATGCSGGGDGDRIASSEATGTTTDDGAKALSLGVGSCTTGDAGAGFVNDSFPQQSGRFIVDMRAYPDGPSGPDWHPIDGVIGFSNGPATAFTDFAAAVRFNPNGQFDVRRGSVYAADFSMAYRPDLGGFRVVLDIDMHAHHYSVWIKSPNGEGLPTEKIANAYPFRTEQASLTHVSNVSAVVDSAVGSVGACSIQVGTCTPTSAGTGWTSREFATQHNTFRVELDAEALDAPIDGVIGLSDGTPHAFGDLAASIRFNPDGHLDVRNGGVYAADTVLEYTAGQRFHVTFDVNLSTARYSVSAYSQYSEGVLATDYAFRTGQGAVTQLNHIGSFVDLDNGEELLCASTVSAL